jgi:hypothetical protein
LTIQHVRFPARHVLKVPGIHKTYLDPGIRQHLIQRNPVNAGGLHRDARHPAFLQPRNQPFQVRPESGIDANVFINNRDGLLANHIKAPLSQFVGQDRIVDGFEQARPQSGIYMEGSVNDLSSNGVFRHG